MFRATMAKFWTKNCPKNGQNFFCHNPNLLYLVLNHKLCLKNNKLAMLRSLGGSQIKKTNKNNGGQPQSFKNNNNNNKNNNRIIINEKGAIRGTPPRGVDPKLPPFHFYLLLSFYYLFIIIFKALRLVAAIFMCFFL